MARHDLEVLRAAVGHYAKEFGLDYTPKFTLPEKGTPRENHMTRDQAAKLLRAARGRSQTPGAIYPHWTVHRIARWRDL
ncbi:MAG: hypothetical protein JKX91_14850 [Rhizobiaceae bacterium]|nr:hypothetical protein [Rhizobiaceae bacterium]